MADKLRTLQQLEHLQQKYIGTGHADTTRHEWTNNIVRDSYASYVGHPALLSYMALGMGECREVVRARFIENMVKGVGPAPRDAEDQEMLEADGDQQEEEQGKGKYMGNASSGQKDGMRNGVSGS